ncbi:MAG: hypothetical protein IT440_05655 [Phycisphaeraceae bacterium]|nr:hypothetical protein [Phycisphaeraceae bacterium]
MDHDQYVGSAKVRKDELAADIARRDGITQGLVCVEPCMSFDLHKDRASRKLVLVLVLVPARRKCRFFEYR